MPQAIKRQVYRGIFPQVDGIGNDIIHQQNQTSQVYSKNRCSKHGAATTAIQGNTQKATTGRASTTHTESPPQKAISTLRLSTKREGPL